MPEGRDVQQQQVLHVLVGLARQDGRLRGSRRQRSRRQGAARVRCVRAGKGARGAAASARQRWPRFSSSGSAGVAVM